MYVVVNQGYQIVYVYNPDLGRNTKYECIYGSKYADLARTMFVQVLSKSLTSFIIPLTRFRNFSDFHRT